MSTVETVTIEASAPKARRLHYGHVMLGVSTMGFLCTLPGQTIVISQFNNVLRETLGLSAAGLSQLYMIATMLAALPLTLVGRFSDRFGTRLAMGLAGVALALACVLMGLVNGPIMLLIGFFCLRFFGQGALSLVSAHALAMWFEKRLGAMESLRTAIFMLVNAGVGYAIIVLINTTGWRLAYPLMGAVVALIVLPMVMFLYRNRPEDIGQKTDGGHLVLEAVSPVEATGDEIEGQAHVLGEPDFTLREALVTRAYAVLAGAVILSPMIGTAMLFHLQPIAATIGMGEEAAAGMLAVFWIPSMLAMLIVGRFADRLPAGKALCAGVSMMALTCVLFATLANAFMLACAMGIFGIGTAMVILTANPTLARYFGRAHHGAIRGVMTTCIVLSTSVGPVIVGYPIDAFGSHRAAFWLFAAMCVPLALTALTLRPPPRPERSAD
ncbi:MAG: MFS transporter [Planctomycetota bacterium]